MKWDWQSTCTISEANKSSITMKWKAKFAFQGCQLAAIVFKGKDPITSKTVAFSM